jgi:H+-transporting ATPase
MDELALDEGEPPDDAGRKPNESTVVEMELISGNHFASRSHSSSEFSSKSLDVGDQRKSGEQAQGEGAEFADLSLEEALRRLRSSPDGLTEADAQLRLGEYGANELTERKKNPVLEFLRYFVNPFSFAMEVGALLALILSDYVDFALIAALLIFNACIGYWESRNAGNAVAALKAQLGSEASVRRNGAFRMLDATQLVPGDVVHLKLGDRVPADCKLLEGRGLLVDQSSLTGESVAVTRDAGGVVFSGSVVTHGEMDALVYATGMRTFFGKTALLVQGKQQQGHFQKVLSRMGWFCIGIILAMFTAEMVVQFGVRGEPCTGVQEGECAALSNALVIIVGGVPIAMPTVLSVTLAMGAARLARKQAIVTRLTVVEELAGLDVLCSDKTGTLTLNELTVEDPIVLDKTITAEELLFNSGLAAAPTNRDAIDSAVIGALTAAQLEQMESEYEVLEFVPFDPVSKRTVSYVRSRGGKRHFCVTKGAPQVILRMATNFAEVEQAYHQAVDTLAARGLRAVGVGRATWPGKGALPTNEHGEVNMDALEWRVLGVLALFDPPRIDTRDTIDRAKELGVRVKMITGDQLPIAVETCKQLGLHEEGADPLIYKMCDLVDAHDEEAINQMTARADGFAEVFPEDKHAVVTRMAHLFHVVGMTGDGVNDAPALKAASVGIAVADATDAARGAADIILVTPGLSVIIDAIRGAREIFQRMKTYCIYALVTSVRIVLTFGLLTCVFGWYFPTILVVILAVLNDGTILTISRDNVTASLLPDHWRLLELYAIAVVLGCWLSGASVLLFALARETTLFQDAFSLPTLSDEELRGLVYIFVSVTGQAVVFSARAPHWIWQARPPAIIVVGAFVLAQTAATIIGALGFNGYPNNGESDFYGCGWGWALAAWICALLAVLPLEPLKMLTFYAMKKLYSSRDKHAFFFENTESMEDLSRPSLQL